jgi:hypothetical protein
MGLTADDLRKELDTYTAEISTRVRTINLGILWLAWLLLLRGSDMARLLNAVSDWALLGVAGACLLALVLDLVQYLFGEAAALEAQRDADQHDGKTEGYDEKSFAYRANRCCYWLKIAITLGAAAAFVYLIGAAMWRLAGAGVWL